MYVPGQTHVFHEITPKTEAEQCVLYPPAESVQAKDASPRGREKHSRSTRSKQDPAAGHWPGTDKSEVFLGFVSSKIHKRCWALTVIPELSFFRQICQLPSSIFMNTLWYIAFSEPKQIETLNYFHSDHSWWTSARLRSRWCWVWNPVPRRKIKFQEFKCKQKEMSPLHNTLYWEKRRVK